MDKQRSKPTVDVATSNSNTRPGASSTYRYRDPDKRRAYMRELMRQRRAAARAKGKGGTLAAP